MFARGAAIAVFCTTFISLFSMIYFAGRREAEDLLTPLRNQMVGTWRVYRTLQVYDPDVKKVVSRDVETSCNIDTDEKKKLVINFHVRGSNLFEDHDIYIDSISLFTNGNKNQLVYFYQKELSIHKHILNRIKDLDNVLVQKVLVVLEFRSERNKVKEMKGVWHDVDRKTTSLIHSIQTSSQPTFSHDYPASEGKVKFEKSKALAANS